MDHAHLAAHGRTSLGRWLALLLALAMLWSQSATGAPTSTLRFKHLGAHSAPSVLALLQDKQGFVWIGTQGNGLLRFDGYQYIAYTHGRHDARSLPSDRVYALHQDAAGALWVGTRGGLARYDPDSDDFTRFTPAPGPASRLDVKAIVSDGQRGLWLATWGGIQHLDPATGAFRQFVHSDQHSASLASDDINALAVDAGGGLWAATWPGGLDYLAPGSSDFQHFRVDTPHRPSAKRNIVRALAFDRARTLWIGTEAGVLTWRAGRRWSERQDMAAPEVRVNQFHIGPDGGVWAGTLSAGLLHWHEKQTLPVRFQYQPNDPYTLPADNIRAVMIDRNGILWAGSFTEGIGLANLNSTGFERMIPYAVSPQNPRPSNFMRGIEGAPGGRLWLGGNTGFALYDPASGEIVKLYRAAPQRAGALMSDLVFSVYQQPGGPLWIGTAAGLHRLDDPAGKFQLLPLGAIANDFINAIEPGHGDWLWLATGRNVIHYNGRTGARRDHGHRDADPTSLAVIGATSILEDRAGRVWIGSEIRGGGLDLLDKASGAVRHFRHHEGRQDSLADDLVTALLQDASGRIWVGTDKGLNEVVTHSDGRIALRSFTEVGSVGETRILAIEADTAGHIWLSTPKGLLRLDPATGWSSQFINDDGMNDAFAVASSYAAADGTLYFGGYNGMTAVRPEQVRVWSSPPPVAITDITVFNRSLRHGVDTDQVRLDGPVSAPRVLTLSGSGSAFSLEFAALHYAAPEKNRYVFQLEGFDRGWVQTDAAHRSATYTNLDPGSYTFKVKASNDRERWSAMPASVHIRILPPWWKTWWFQILSIGLTLGLLMSLYRLRIRRLSRQRAELADMVAMRTLELEASNAKLAALATTDGLTGITNRRGFDAALQREWRRAKREGKSVALTMFDIDHFKRYNDHYGHQGGDQALVTVARLIAAQGRRPSDVAARYGGEEFILLTTAIDGAQALHKAQDMCAALARLALPHAMSPHGVITLSAGVAAMVPRADATPEQLLQLADGALYRAKQEGRNRAMQA
jgi:diguanylate cyclase (GGDEF)-like protein